MAHYAGKGPIGNRSGVKTAAVRKAKPRATDPYYVHGISQESGAPPSRSKVRNKTLTTKSTRG